MLNGAMKVTDAAEKKAAAIGQTVNHIDPREV
jgi:hypothetical protein